ncbi:nitroreductase family protein [Ornithinimicrobium sp. F0845]|uniref:nitroreductase family protein n=1 Tax=Ornithinimicrobium sp. F0845 TaxID=2926412 RepID=UPI001FF455DE|nr:nitroreductase family protein [Ornithinimicrobium sp. F0845]MCK0111738.1 nitroreductase family protein [Ornithinimicrobium sp. F0845]
MEFSHVVRARRMVRNYDPDRPVPDEVLSRVLENAVRAPSAGFSQGWDFVVLRSDEERAAFWEATTDPASPPDSWLRGILNAPCLIVCCSNPGAYLDRYAEPDKGWTDRDAGRWPVPYWDVDTGMAALLMLLTAVDEELAGLFFGVPVERLDTVREALGIPDDRNLVGVVSLGYRAPDRKSPSLSRGRREVEQVAHAGRFGTPLDL